MRRLDFRTLGILIPLCACGCLEIETRIKLAEDGSATITERLRFSRSLLELSATDGAAKGIDALLTKPAALKRMKQMGKAVTLVRHEVRDAENGSRESVTVFKIRHVNDLTYVSPYLAARNYPKHTALRARLRPNYESKSYGQRAGLMALTFAPPTREPPRRQQDKPPKGPTPAEQQVLRDLRPIAVDLMKGLQLKLTFECYAPIRFRHYYRYRSRLAGTNRYDLIDFTYKDMDKFGRPLLGNEEIMLELLAFRFGGANVVDHVSGHADNLTVPVYHPSGTPTIYFRPSRAMFDKHFAGKTLKFLRREGGPRRAKWEEIGYKGDAAKKNGATKKPKAAKSDGKNKDKATTQESAK